MAALLETPAPSGLAQAEAAFLEANPSFRETAVLDELRATEYGRLDAGGDVYLDYTGGSLYAESQVEEHMRMLREGVFGNPHSANPTSSAATGLVEQARAAVLRYFNAPESEYECIFTAERHGRAAARRRGLSVRPVPRHLRQPQLGQRHPRVRPREGSDDGVRAARRPRSPRGSASRTTSTRPRVTACSRIPAQSNFSGVKHPLEWIDLAHERGWDVLLDCAAFAPTSRLDLSRWKPDFVAVSFYKMFGYPTGLGALIARRRTLERLERPWFSGGTVVAANVQGDMVVPHSGHAGFEDGTVDYLGIPAVEIGLRHLERIGIDTIAQRVESLGSWLLDEMQRLAARGRQPGDPHLRPGDVGPPRWHDRVQLPAPGRRRGRRAPRGPRGGGAQHLAPDRLLLQPRSRRGRVLDLRGEARREVRATG